MAAAEVEAGKESSIFVAVRVRPPHPDEVGARLVRAVDGNVVVFDPSGDREHGQGPPPSVGTGGYVPRPRAGRDLAYAFDAVFDEESTQQDVYDGAASQLVRAVLSGYNASCFAYGATGAGKTHTMIGGGDAGPGVMVLTMRELFAAVRSDAKEEVSEITMTYIEVYNETVRDLLDASGGQALPGGRGLTIREDATQGVHVVGATKHFPSSAEEVMMLLERGNRCRRQCATVANATSSRSHAVCQITVQTRDRAGGTTQTVRKGKLSLVDLAGSERATKNRGQRFVEGANINRSLLALGNCINALCSATATARHIPYRDSKLTRLLKDSLGGNCKTVMIANVVSVAGTNAYEDTHNTLKYANRAKDIKTKLVRNEIDVDVHFSKYAAVVTNLRSELEKVRERLRKSEADRERLAAVAAESAAGTAAGTAVAADTAPAASPRTPPARAPGSARHDVAVSPMAAGGAAVSARAPAAALPAWVDDVRALSESRLECKRGLREIALAEARCTFELQRLQEELTLFEQFQRRAEDHGFEPNEKPDEVAAMRARVAELQHALRDNRARRADLDGAARDAERVVQELKTRLADIDDPVQVELVQSLWLVMALSLERTELETESQLHALRAEYAGSLHEGATRVVSRLTGFVSSMYGAVADAGAVTDAIEQNHRYALYFAPYTSLAHNALNSLDISASAAPAAVRPPYAHELDASAFVMMSPQAQKTAVAARARGDAISGTPAPGLSAAVPRFGIRSTTGEAACDEEDLPSPIARGRASLASTVASPGDSAIKSPTPRDTANANGSADANGSAESVTSSPSSSQVSLAEAKSGDPPRSPGMLSAMAAFEAPVPGIPAAAAGQDSGAPRGLALITASASDLSVGGDAAQAAITHDTVDIVVDEKSGTPSFGSSQDGAADGAGAAGGAGAVSSPARAFSLTPAIPMCTIFDRVKAAAASPASKGSRDAAAAERPRGCDDGAGAERVKRVRDVRTRIRSLLGGPSNRPARGAAARQGALGGGGRDRAAGSAAERASGAGAPPAPGALENAVMASPLAKTKTAASSAAKSCPSPCAVLRNIQNIESHGGGGDTKKPRSRIPMLAGGSTVKATKTKSTTGMRRSPFSRVRTEKKLPSH